MKINFFFYALFIGLFLFFTKFIVDNCCYDCSVFFVVPNFKNPVPSYFMSIINIFYLPEQFKVVFGTDYINNRLHYALLAAIGKEIRQVLKVRERWPFHPGCTHESRGQRLFVNFAVGIYFR